MSEVIVRMDMPKDCANCPMVDDDARFCKATKEYIPMLGKPSWCPIAGELPEQHGNLIDGDLAKARIHKNIIDYYENASGGYYLAEDAEEEVGLMVKYEIIVPATERSET